MAKYKFSNVRKVVSIMSVNVAVEADSLEEAKAIISSENYWNDPDAYPHIWDAECEDEVLYVMGVDDNDGEATETIIYHNNKGEDEVLYTNNKHLTSWCLDCNREVVYEESDVNSDELGEHITCPHCKSTFNIG